ncbi:MAG: hypothetical protein ACKO96_46205 [Flammeovirgaceae bacterium]
MVGKGWGNIKGFGFVQYEAELLGKNLTDFSLAGVGLLTGKYNGRADNSFTDLFGPPLSKQGELPFIGNNWSVDLTYGDYSLSKLQSIYNFFKDGNYKLNFFKLNGYRPKYYTIFNRWNR